MQNKKLERAMHENARQATQFYKRRCWWVSVEDVYQEALVAQLDAIRRFDPTKANEKYEDQSEYYQQVRLLWMASVYATRRLVLKSSSPVSASHRLEVLKGLYRAPIFEDSAVVADNADSAVYARQVLDRLVECLGVDGARFALSMIVDEWNAQDVAVANGVQRADVLQEMLYLRGKLRSDEVLHQLWQEGS